MQTVQINLCIRCGKQRVITQVLEENVGGSVVKITEMSCPDADCQEFVNKKHEKERVEKEKLKDSTYKTRSHWTKKSDED